jgi:PIN domain nuclease of toxin-antitoxin system
MIGHTVRLEAIAEEQGVTVIDVTSEIGLVAATLPWDHRDPFDRIILATAYACRVPLISADAVFDDLLSTETWSKRIW